MTNEQQQPVELTLSQQFILTQIENARYTLDVFEQSIKNNTLNVMQERMMSALLSRFNGQKK